VNIQHLESIADAVEQIRLSSLTHLPNNSVGECCTGTSTRQRRFPRP
jgi:hypothetical protein